MFDEQLLQGQAGIVTGGSSGIGLAIARYLAARGASLTITGRDGEKLEKACGLIEGEAIGAKGDVRNKEDVQKNLKKHLEAYGKVDFLINNAAGNFLCSLEKMSENGFKAVTDIVMHGTFLWSKAVFPEMKQQSYGRIVNIGTTYAWGPAPLVAHSGAAKAAVLSLTKTMAVEWAQEGIRTNMIAPGPVEGTEGVKRLLGHPQAKEQMMAYLPVRRMAKGEEVGALACFLLSPAADYINGACIPIDGGVSLNVPGLLPAPLAEMVKQLE